MNYELNSGNGENKGPTKSQVQVMMSDWLGNLRQGEEGGYTHKGKGGIDYSGPSITDYIIGDTDGLDTLDLMKKSLAGARKITDSIVPEKVEVNVSDYQSCHSRNRMDTGNGQQNIHRINLATDYFDDKTLKNRQKSAIMLGLACHEASHAAFTDEDCKKRMIDKTPEQLRELQFQIWNVIEDERIEYLLGEDSPGYTPLIAEVKKHYFKKVENDINKGGEPTEALPRLLNNLIHAIRYPSSLTEKRVLEHFDELDAMRKVLTPYPLDAQSACDAAEKILDVIGHLVKDEQDKQKKKKQEQQQQQQTGNENKQDGQSGKANGQEKNKTPKNQKQEIRDALEKALSSPEAQRVMQAIKKDSEKATTDSQGNNTSVQILRDDDKKKYVNEESAEKMQGGEGFSRKYIYKPAGDQIRYEMLRSEVNRYIPAMSKALTCKTQESEFVNRGMPTGRLNTCKLASYTIGNKNIFDKRGTIECSSASVCLLIDESGSMRGTKNIMTKQAAVLINETIKKISHVGYYCYGYSSQGMNVYCENGKTSRWSLSDVQADGGTPTGAAMRETAARIRRMNRNPVLLLVLTDGCAHDTGLVLEMNKKLAKENFVVIGVGIQTSYVEDTFKNNIVINDISELPFLLGKLTKKHLDKMLVNIIR